MNRIKDILLLVVLAVLAVGCNDDALRKSVADGTPVNVRMSLNVAPLTGNGLMTRGGQVDESTQEDGTIHDLWVLQFAGTDDDSPLREARYYDSYDPEQMFKLIASSVPNRVVLVANTFDDEIAFSHCTDLSEFNESFRAVHDETDLVTVVAGKYSSLMSAYTDVTLSEAGVTLNFNLKRTICKINVTITNTTKETSATDIDIQKVSVRSVPSHSFFFNSYDLPERYPAKYDGDRVDYPGTDWDDGVGTDDSKSFTFYLPVNKCGTAAVPHNPLLRGDCAPDGATFLSITGTYDDASDPSIKRPVEFRVMLGASETDYNLLPNCKYDYTVTINDKSDIMFDSREIEQEVEDFCSWEHANTYMIHPSRVEGTWKNYRIPVAKCYEFWNPIDGYYKNADNALMRGSKGWHAEVIWSEMPITYDVNFKWVKQDGNDYLEWFEFSLPSDFEHGNIIIGLKRWLDDGQTQMGDDYIWSWQMWVTDYDPNPALDYTPQVDAQGNELRFAYTVPGGDVHRYNFDSWKTGDYKDCFIMDRNLGALSVGPFVNKAKGFLFYAWGRKDPFPHRQTVYPGPSGSTYGAIHTNSTGYTDNVLYSIAHPNKYIYGPSLWGTNYWQKTSVSANVNNPWGDPVLFGTTKGKSVYDPCPPGWRVPRTDVLNKSLTNNTNASSYRYYDLAADIKAVYPTGGSLLCDRNGIEQGNQVYMWYANGSLSSNTAIGDQNACGRYVRCVSDKPFD